MTKIQISRFLSKILLNINKIFIWHQGALGDLLSAGPALAAIIRHYSGARITAFGHPERWGLLAESLPMEKVWDSGEGRWASLFSKRPLPSQIRDKLSEFQLAVVFNPRPQISLQNRLLEAGIPKVHWLPSFPETGTESVANLQACRLAACGIHYVPSPFKLVLKDSQEEELIELLAPGLWLAVAPGSGQALKNWPLSHYYEVTRALAWKFHLKVIWLAGPAEEAMLPYLEPLARSQGQILVSNRPLTMIASILARCRLYLGNDSGITHLAAAVPGPEVVALFGPTDPLVWAPLGSQVHTLIAPCPQAPCAAGRTIPCSESHCLEALTAEAVIAEAAQLLSA